VKHLADHKRTVDFNHFGYLVRTRGFVELMPEDLYLKAKSMEVFRKLVFGLPEFVAGQTFMN
jgi:hypothetical protein